MTIIPGRDGWRRLGWGLALALVVVVLDQASKLAIIRTMVLEPRVIEVLPFLNIVMAWNPGVSFGFLGGHDVSPWVLFAVAGAFSVGLALWMARMPERIGRLGLALMIGGAVGNAIDRVVWGAVADFIDVHAFGWHFWAFNVADAGISVGAAILIADGLFRRPS